MTEKDVMKSLLDKWREYPVAAIKVLFGVEPTEQQKKMILDAFHSHDARVAVSSCQGAGKTASLVWLMFIFLLTQPDPRVLVTSPSYQQLGRVFHSETLKWYHKMPEMFKREFVIQKEMIYKKDRPHYKADLVTASAEHKENLQGGHSDSYIILADEASGIEEGIFDLLLGTLGTGKGGRFVMTSNPLRATGRFYEVFHREELLKKWKTHYFSALDSPVINDKWITEMKETYGDDSDIYRVRVLGRFPRSSTTQFFKTDAVMEAIQNDLPRHSYIGFPKILGVDVARFGDDMTVFCLRQGPKILAIEKFNGLDGMEVVSKLIEFQQQHQANLIFIDAIGVGSGPYDRAKELGLPVKPVYVSNKSTDPLQYCNLRAQLYGAAREWLYNGADIPKDDDLRKQLLSVEYGFTQKSQIQMAQKKLIKAKGLDSPDIPDALTLTFAGEANSRRMMTQQARPVAKPNFLWV